MHYSRNHEERDSLPSRTHRDPKPPSQFQHQHSCQRLKQVQIIYNTGTATICGEISCLFSNLISTYLSPTCPQRRNLRCPMENCSWSSNKLPTSQLASRAPLLPDFLMSWKRYALQDLINTKTKARSDHPVVFNNQLRERNLFKEDLSLLRTIALRSLENYIRIPRPQAC